MYYFVETKQNNCYNNMGCPKHKLQNTFIYRCIHYLSLKKKRFIFCILYYYIGTYIKRRYINKIYRRWICNNCMCLNKLFTLLIGILNCWYNNILCFSYFNLKIISLHHKYVNHIYYTRTMIINCSNSPE